MHQTLLNILQKVSGRRILEVHCEIRLCNDQGDENAADCRLGGLGSNVSVPWRPLAHVKSRFCRLHDIIHRVDHHQTESSEVAGHYEPAHGMVRDSPAPDAGTVQPEDAWPHVSARSLRPSIHSRYRSLDDSNSQKFRCMLMAFEVMARRYPCLSEAAPLDRMYKHCVTNALIITQ